MSTTVDNRVVEMEFDNSKFESNVQTSMSTLEKLKQSLNLEDSAKGLENISNAANNCDISPLGSAVETVKAKFSALEVVAITALANITSSVMNTAGQMINSLTIEPISDGFEEYELKMNSVQTIMASTGESLETVTGYLDELNLYADKTIYSFSDMTSSIGKFTNSGVELGDAVKAIQGISNEAAVSGANAEEASRAMYNFAQALSAGSVKLIDWKSIEQANMATVEFKNELMQTAVELGTLVKVGDKYQSTTTDANGKVSELFTTTNKFTDSLSSQWMTTEVLVETLGKYADENTEIGKKAFAAAQDVKTFSQMMDALKEAVGSGWASSFEIIIGNFDEAKILWTSVNDVISDILNNQANARNEILQSWKDLGGRTAIIDSIRNAFNALLSIITPIKEAFVDIFPPITGQQLADLSEKIKDITSKFILSDSTAEKLYSTFKGLFAVIDILGQAFSAVVGGITPLLSIIPGVGDGILGVTANFGEWISKIDETLKKNETFKNAVNTVVTFLQSIPGKIDSVFQSITGSSIGEVFETIKTKITDAITAIKEAFAGFSGIDTSSFDSFIEDLKTKFAPLDAVLEGVKKVFNGIVAFFKSISPVISTIVTAIGNALASFGEHIYTIFSNMDFSNILDIANSGLFAAVILGIKNFVEGLTSVATDAGVALAGIGLTLKNFLGNASGMLASIKSIFDGVGGCLEAWQQNLKADTLIKIATAIGIITAALFVLSTIDSDKLGVALAAITAEFVDLFAFMSEFEKSMGNSGFANIIKVTAAMNLLATAVLILSAAMKSIAELDWTDVIKGMYGLAGTLVILIESAKELSTINGNITKTSAGLILFATAIKILTSSVTQLGNLDVSQLVKGLAGVGVMCKEIQLFLEESDLDELGVKKGLGLVAFSASLLVLSSAVEKLSGLNVGELIKGLTSLGVMLTEISLFIKYTDNSSSFISTSTGLIALGAAMLVISKAIESMGKLSVGTLAKGLTSMAASLAIIGVAVEAMPVTMPIIATGMLLVGAALNVIALALTNMGKLSLGEVAIGLTAMAGSLAIVAVAANAMITALPGAAAMLVMAGAIAVLTPALMALGSMSLAEIGTAILALAASFAVIGASSVILAPLTPVILAVSAAILLFGTGVLAAGVGITALATGLTALGAAFAVNSAAIIAAIESIINLIPQLATKMGEGFVAMVTAIADSSASLISAVATILDALFQAIIDSTPKFVEAAKTLLEGLAEVVVTESPTIVAIITSLISDVLQVIKTESPEIVDTIISVLGDLLDGIVEFVPQLVNAGCQIITGFLQGLANNVDSIATAGTNLVVNFLNAIGTQAPRIIDAAFNLMINFINGLTNSINTNTPVLIASIQNLMTAIINAGTQALAGGRKYVS